MFGSFTGVLENYNLKYPAISLSQLCLLKEKKTLWYFWHYFDENTTPNYLACDHHFKTYDYIINFEIGVRNI